MVSLWVDLKVDIKLVDEMESKLEGDVVARLVYELAVLSAGL